MNLIPYLTSQLYLSLDYCDSLETLFWFPGYHFPQILFVHLLNIYKAPTMVARTELGIGGYNNLFTETYKIGNSNSIHIIIAVTEVKRVLREQIGGSD